MRCGEIWWADTGDAGDRPVLILTRNPMADRLERVVVAQVTTNDRGLISEMQVGESEGLDRNGVVSFDNIATLRRAAFRKRIGQLDDNKRIEACTTMSRALGCGWL